MLAHSVSAISIQSVVGLEALPDEPDNAAAALRSIRAVSTRALADLRSAVGVLRDPAHSDAASAPSRPIGGLADLDRVVGTAAVSGVTVTVRTTGAAVAVPLVVDAAAYRIVQESITNVLRHSASSQALVEVAYREREIALRISNPAAGQPIPTLSERAGFGVAGMRERAELLAGTLRAGPTADGGFVVCAVLPFPASS